MTNWVMAGNSAPMSLNILAKVGITSHSMAVTASTATQTSTMGYISAPDHLAAGFPRLGDLLVEFHQHQGHLPGDFAGADDLDPMMLEDADIAGGGGVDGTARRHARGDLVQDVPQLETLVLRGANLERLQQRRARADQRRELLEEGSSCRPS